MYMCMDPHCLPKLFNLSENASKILKREDVWGALFYFLKGLR